MHICLQKTYIIYTWHTIQVAELGTSFLLGIQDPHVKILETLRKKPFVCHTGVSAISSHIT